MIETARIARLMRPASIAIIGASDNPTRIGGRPLRYLCDAGFAGAIYPVNPNYQMVQGLTAYPAVDALPQVPDLAIIALPAVPALAAATTCARIGVGAVIMFSADFAEAGEDGRRRQEELTRLGIESGMAILGPNCLGAFNASHRMYGSFSAIFENGFPAAGDVGIVSQSGGYGSHLTKIALQRGVKIGQWMTTGNEAGIDVGTAISWMASQPDIRTILAYAEGVHARDTLVAGLSAARDAGKPVLFFKSGGSEVGAAAAQTHTAAMSGSDAVFDGMLAQFGTIRMHHTEAMVDAAYLLQRAPRMASNRVGLVTISGAVGVQMADAAAENGLEVPPMPAANQTRLKSLNPYAAVRNPVDITAQAFNDLDLVRENLDVVLQNPDYDALVAFFTVTAGSKAIAPGLSAALSPLPQQHPRKPMVLCIVAEAETVRRYEDAGFAVFEDPYRAMNALGILARLATPKPADTPAVPPDLLAAADAALRQHDGTEANAKAVLSALGIQIPDGRIAADAADAAAAAREIGGAVAVKIHSATILHKSEAGGVALNLRSPEAAGAAAAEMLARLPDAGGVLVERMADPGLEFILGLHHDSELGPVIMLGLGGFYAELYKDVCFRLAPVTAAEAKKALMSLGGRRAYDGFRSQAAADIDAVAQTAATLSAYFAARSDKIASLEINPLRALPPGKGVIACDAVLLKK